ncbi:MAG: HD domain-containing response regulator [Elusimicrobiota bacterium]
MEKTPFSEYKILIVDDEPGIVRIVTSELRRRGYNIEGETNPERAIERVRDEGFDLLVLDYLMTPIHGNTVVEKIREFNTDVYILLLTGYKDIAPPLQSLRALDIQGYCEKQDDLNQLMVFVESGLKSISMMKTIKQFRDGLNKILESVPKIYQLQPIDSIMEDILRELIALVYSKNAFIMIDDISESGQEKKSIFRGLGKYHVDIKKFFNMLEPSFMELIGQAREDKIVTTADGGVIFPLINELKDTIGVIFVESRNIDDGMKILEIYANQAASSLNNAFLHSMVNKKNEELNQTYEELRKRYLDTVEALRLTVDAKDIYTRGHSDRVSYYAVKIGAAMGINNGDIEKLKISGVFHDVGKIGTADDILFKESKLDKEEYDEIKKHPLKGAHILSAMSMFKEIVPIIKSHHERIDGNGYPFGIKGEEIPLLARILAVADAFDAMTTDRKYRKKLELKDAKQQLKDGAGTQFDKNIVDVFLKILDTYDKIQEDLASTFLSTEEDEK